jgi:hypothetical protein
MANDFAAQSAKWLRSAVLSALSLGIPFVPKGRLLQLTNVSTTAEGPALTLSDTLHSIVAYPTAECAASIGDEYGSLAELRGATLRIVSAELRSEKGAATAATNYIAGPFVPRLVLSEVRVKGGLGQAAYGAPAALDRDGACLAELEKLKLDPPGLNALAPVLSRAQTRHLAAFSREVQSTFFKQPEVISAATEKPRRPSSDHSSLTPCAIAPSASAAAPALRSPVIATAASSAAAASSPAVISAPHAAVAEESPATAAAAQPARASLLLLSSPRTAPLPREGPALAADGDAAKQRPLAAAETAAAADGGDAADLSPSVFSSAASQQLRFDGDVADDAGTCLNADAQRAAKRARAGMPAADAELEFPTLWSFAFSKTRVFYDDDSPAATRPLRLTRD